jgi:hypothetical protein
VVLFGYQSETIRRIVNVYRFALHVQTTGSCLARGRPYFNSTKPRFVLDDGRLRLLPNPVQTEEQLLDLVFQPGYAERFSRHDYFKGGYDLDAHCPQLSFPYLLALARIAWGAGATRDPRPDHISLLMNDPETLRLLQAIFDEFAAFGKAEGFVAVLVFFGGPDEILHYARTGRHKRMAPLVQYAHDRGYPHIDAVEILAAHNTSAKTAGTDEPVSVYFDETVHHTVQAHRIIAAGMAERLAPYVGTGSAPAPQPAPVRPPQ